MGTLLLLSFILAVQNTIKAEMTRNHFDDDDDDDDEDEDEDDFNASTRQKGTRELNYSSRPIMKKNRDEHDEQVDKYE
jgi:hypothetical protein